MNCTRLLIATAFLLALSVIALSIGDCHGTLDCHVTKSRRGALRSAEPPGANARRRPREERTDRFGSRFCRDAVGDHRCQHTAYETVHKATQHAAEIIEGNFNVATTAASRSTQPADEQT